MERTIKYYNNRPVIVLKKHEDVDFYQILVDIEIQDVDLDYIAESFRGCDACMVGHKSTCYCDDRVSEAHSVLEEIMDNYKINDQHLFFVPAKDLKDKPFEWAENKKLEDQITANKNVLNGLIDIVAENKSLIKQQEKILENHKAEILKSDRIVENRKALAEISDKEYEALREKIRVLNNEHQVLVESKDKTIKISYKDYEELLDRDRLLGALESGGVDNWEWYGESIQQYYENEEE